MINLDLERLKAKAIDEAVGGNYQEAIEINKQILEKTPSDVDSLMQLAHAYWQIGSLEKARTYYRQALANEPNNNLAKKRLALLNSLNQQKQPNITNRPKAKIVAIAELIEEPGKTKIVKLSNIGKPEHLGLLKIGEQVFLKLRKRRLELRDIENNFIGCLPDDISKRLISFINQKGKYECYVFSIDKNEVKIFLKEVFKPKKLHHVSSFINEDNDLQFDEEEKIPVKKIEDTDIDLDSEKILLSPEEVLEAEKNDEDEDDEDEDEDDKETYQEYEE